MLNFFRRLKYLSTQAFSPKYLLITNCGISISLSSVGKYLFIKLSSKDLIYHISSILGDVIEQKYEIYKKEIEKWDRRRTLNMATAGFTVGIFCHHWYNYLDHKIPGKRHIRTVFKKVMVDQLIASPIVILLFFATLGIMKQETLPEAIEEIKNKWIRLYAAEWVVWPPAQIINFYLLPTKYRVLYDNTISLGYDVYTSYVINDPTSKKETQSTQITSNTIISKPNALSS